MARWIDMSDGQRAAIELRILRKRDFKAELTALCEEAAQVKARTDLRESTRERFLEQLRRDYSHVLRDQARAGAR